MKQMYDFYNVKAKLSITGFDWV